MRLRIFEGVPLGTRPGGEHTKNARLLGRAAVRGIRVQRSPTQWGQRSELRLGPPLLCLKARICEVHLRGYLPVSLIKLHAMSLPDILGARVNRGAYYTQSKPTHVREPKVYSPTHPRKKRVNATRQHPTARFLGLRLLDSVALPFPKKPKAPRTNNSTLTDSKKYTQQKWLHTLPVH